MPSRNELVGGLLFVIGVLLVAVGPIGGTTGFAVGIGAVFGLSAGTILIGTAVDPEPVRELGSD